MGPGDCGVRIVQEQLCQISFFAADKLEALRSSVYICMRDSLT